MLRGEIQNHGDERQLLLPKKISPHSYPWSVTQFVVVFFNERCVTIVTVLLFGARTWPPRREKANARNYSQKL